MNINEFKINDEGVYRIINRHEDHVKRTTSIIDKGGKLLEENLKQLAKEMGLDIEVLNKKEDKENTKGNPIQEVSDMEK